MSNDGKYPLTEDGIRDALAALGPTADRVAETLRLFGIKGQRETCNSCPVAEYLHRVVEGVSFVEVRRMTVRVLRDVGVLVAVDTPTPVHRFVDAFDGGAWYQDLAG